MPGVVGSFQQERDLASQRQSDLYNASLAGFQQQQQTGGFDPTQLGNLRTQLATWMPTGGMDPAQLALAQQGYGNFAQTGGLSAADKANFMNQATSGNQALMSSLAGAAGRSQAATGGNLGAALSSIQRQGGQQLAQGVTGAQTNLANLINQGKLAGLQGGAALNAQLASARQGVGGLATGLESNVASGVQAANRGIQGLFDTTTGQLTSAGQQILQGLGLQFGTENQAASIQQALSQNPGLFQTGFNDFVNFLKAV
jgi:hypothetical protein